MLWWYGYRAKPDGRVCISDSFTDAEEAKTSRNKLRAPDMAVTPRINAVSAEDALKQAKQFLS